LPPIDLPEPSAERELRALTDVALSEAGVGLGELRRQAREGRFRSERDRRAWFIVNGLRQGGDRGRPEGATPWRTGDLDAQARSFALRTADLLNNTVTHGVEISALRTTTGRAVMGSGLTPTSIMPRPISIGLEGSRPVVFLYLVHTYGLDPEGVYLTMSASTMSLYSSPGMADDELIVAIDYVREPVDPFPGAHLRVAGDRRDLDRLHLGMASRHRRLRDLHLPVGGRRFRPTLEDLIQFMVTEEMVIPRPQWRSVMELHRAEWEASQVRAAARRCQEDAARALREAGWAVHPPGADDPGEDGD
jgi:hypothetical protein